MAKILSDLALHISADSAELQKGLERVKAQLSSFGGGFKKMGSEVGTVLSSMGTAIGGVVGDMAGLVESLATAAGPIGMLVVAIGAIGLSWKKSTEEIKKYNEEVDKTKYGAPIFQVDTKKARNETLDFAKGGIGEGFTLITTAAQGLTDIKTGKLKDANGELKKYYENMQKVGILLRDQNEELAKTVGYEGEAGTHEKYNRDTAEQWDKKRNELAIQDAKLAVDRLKTETEIKIQDAELFNIRAKMYSETDPAKKQELENRFATVALDIHNKTYKMLDNEKNVKDQLLTMEGRTQELKMYDLNIDKQKADAELKYGEAAVREARMEHQIGTAKEKNLKIEEEIKKLKDQAILDAMDGHLKEQTAIDQKYDNDIKKAKDNEALKDAITEEYVAHSLAVQKKYDDEEAKLNKEAADKAFDLKKKELDKEKKEEEKQLKLKDLLQLKIAENGVNALAGAFENLFTKGKNGWKDMLQSMVHYFEVMIAKVLAAIAVWAILDALSGGAAAIGGTTKGPGTLGEFLKKSIFHFDTGTSFVPGGLSLVGESGPEIVNLPRGSQVFSNTQTRNMLGSGGEVVFRIEGTTLVGVLNNHNRKISSFS
jgi:hypothetical protein